MRFCQSHWDALRKEIDKRGLTPFIAKDGLVAVKQLAQQVKDRDVTKATFDPLMSSHWAIINNVMERVSDTGNSPLYFLSQGPEDPVVGYPGHEGKTWSRCPLCYLNLAHEISCTDPKCVLDKQKGYDWMLERAADEALERAQEFGLRPSNKETP